MFYVPRGFFSAVLRYVREEEKEELVFHGFSSQIQGRRETISSALISNHSAPSWNSFAGVIFILKSQTEKDSQSVGRSSSL